MRKPGKRRERRRRSSVKGQDNVPVFVLEYLLANSCSTDDEEKIKEGVENVHRVLREHYVNPDEADLIKAKIRERGTYMEVGTHKVTT